MAEKDSQGNARPEKTRVPQADFDCSTSSLGDPVRVYVYRDHQARSVGKLATYVKNGKEEVRAWHWNVKAKQRRSGWYTDDERVVYNRHLLDASHALVLIVCNEECVELLHQIVPADKVKVFITAVAGGLAEYAKTDFAPLMDANLPPGSKGRAFLICPNANPESGLDANKLKTHLQNLGARSVIVLDVADKPEDWRLVDELKTREWDRNTLNKFVKERTKLPTNAEQSLGETRGKTGNEAKPSTPIAGSQVSADSPPEPKRGGGSDMRSAASYGNPPAFNARQK